MPKQLVEGPVACSSVEVFDLDWSTAEDNPTEDNLVGFACSDDVIGLGLDNHRDRDRPDDPGSSIGFVGNHAAVGSTSLLSAECYLWTLSPSFVVDRLSRLPKIRKGSNLALLEGFAGFLGQVWDDQKSEFCASRSPYYLCTFHFLSCGAPWVRRN